MKVRTHLMFQGDAVAALALYRDVFPEFDVVESQIHGENDPGPAGTLRMARALFAGHELLIIDSPPIHDFDFTPSVSLFVDFESEAALDDAFARLSDGGTVMMPLGDHGFSRRFGWLADRFGVSWQLNLP